MAELHPNQIPYEAPEPAMINLVSPKDYISSQLRNMAGLIEDAAEFQMKLDDVKLAATVKANMAEGIQNIKNGDAIAGDYTALKNDALALYQKSFEGASKSAINRYMRQNPEELKEYELSVEAIVAEKENKAADVRIRKELNNIASRVALGQLSWTDAVNMLHVMGGDKINSEQYEAYTEEMRSEIDRYQLTMYLSGDMQSNLTALEKLQDPNTWDSLSPTDRANAKARAQSNIDQMLAAMAKEKEKDDGEPYKTIENSILNSAYMWRDLGDGDQLTQLKDQVENLALTGKFDMFGSKGEKIATINYTDLQPRQWGKIREELDKVQLHSIKQQQYDTNFNVTSQKLEANLEQGYANQTMSNSEELANLMKDPRAADILKPEKAAALTLKADEFIDKLAASLRPTVDIDTPVSYSTALGGLFREVKESPWARANNLVAWADYQKFILGQRGMQDILNKIKLSWDTNNKYSPDVIVSVADHVLKTDEKELTPKGKVLKSAFQRAKDDYYLEPGDVAALLTGDYSEAYLFEPLHEAKQTFQDLVSTARKNVFNGKYAAYLVPNSRMEYVVGLAGLTTSPRDLEAAAQKLGYPKGIEITPKIAAEAVRSVGSVLERNGVRDQIATSETRKEDAELFMKAIMLDKLNRTPEQKEVWDSTVYSAEFGQSNKDGPIARWWDTPSENVPAETYEINVPEWTRRNQNKG